MLEDDWKLCKEKVQSIVEETLAYYLASDEEKENLLEMFDVIAKYCIDNVKEPYQRYVCSRSLLSVKKMLHIQNWVTKNLNNILACQNTIELLKTIFNCLIELT